MKLKNGVLGAGVFFSMLGVSTSGSAQTGVTIFIKPDHAVFRLNQAVRLSILISNGSMQPLRLSEFYSNEHGEADYLVYVCDSQGRPAALTDYGHRTYDNIQALVPGVFRSIDLAPKALIKDEAIVNTLYDMNNLGSYVIQVERKLPAEFGGRYVTSNAVTVTVVE